MSASIAAPGPSGVPEPFAPAAVAAIRGRPGPAELVALVLALDAVDDAVDSAPAERTGRGGRWNDPAAGMRSGSWAHDLSPRRYGRPSGSHSSGGN